MPGLDLLPANKDLAGFPVEVAAFHDRADRLRRRLDDVPEGTWDAVLIDAPPSVSLVTENVLRAATEVVLPVGLTYLALDGCAEILASLEALRRETGRAPGGHAGGAHALPEDPARRRDPGQAPGALPRPAGRAARASR